MKTLSKKHWVMIIVGILAIVAVWYFMIRKPAVTAPAKESSYNGGLPFPGDNSFAGNGNEERHNPKAAA